MIRGSKFLTAAVSITISSCVAGSFGNELVPITMSTDGWTLSPVSDSGSTTYIIATRNDYEASMTDIDVVLYERVSNDWFASAYGSDVTLEDALLDLADEIGLPDPRDGDWMIGFDEANVLDYVTPRMPFGKGFFVQDPLYDIAQQLENADPLVEGAEDAGFEAASSVTNTGSVSGGSFGGGDAEDPEPGDCGCDDACVQNLLSNIVEAHLDDPTIPIELVMQEETEGVLCPCYYSIAFASPPTPWTAWACAAWGNVVPDASGICRYSTTATRIRTRVVTKHCFSCITGYSTVTWTQFQTMRGTLNVNSAPDANGNCTPPSCSAPFPITKSLVWTPIFGPPCPRP